MTDGCTARGPAPRSGAGGGRRIARIESRSKALKAAKAALNKHADEVVVMDVRRLCGVTDFFVICTAGSPPQMRAIREAVEETLRREGQRVWHVEGSATPARAASRSARARESEHSADGLSWLLLDCGDVVVHVLNPPARSFYQLERLWGDAPQIPLDPNA